MRKAIKFEKGSAGEAAQQLLCNNQFDVTEYLSHLTFSGEKYNSRLTVTVNKSYGADECSVTFSGVGVNSSRCMNYTVATMPKLAARIKRLVLKANDIISRRARRTASADKVYAKTRKIALANGIETIKQSLFGGSAVCLINGYSIDLHENMLVDVNISGNNVKVSIELAITMISSLPFNPSFDAEDWEEE